MWALVRLIRNRPSFKKSSGALYSFLQQTNSSLHKCTNLFLFLITTWDLMNVLRFNGTLLGISASYKME